MKFRRFILGIVFVVAANQTFGAVRQASVAAASLVEVIIQNSDGAPIEGAEVSLAGDLYSTDAELKVIEKTNSVGRAAFGVLPAGCYKVKAARSGYFALNSLGDREAAATAEISIGELRPLVSPCGSNSLNPSIRLTLVAQATIAGHIRNANGSPLSGASVSLMKILYPYGQRFLYGVRSGKTDNRGGYQISGLLAGEYIIRVNNEPNGDRDDNTTYIGRTYYPGANDVRDAVPVSVKAGQEANNIDFALRPVPKGVTISGKAFNRESGGTPEPNKRVSSPIRVFLISTHEGLAEPLALNGTASGENDGTEFPFEIRNVPPGEYNLYAAFTDPTRKDPNSPPFGSRFFAGQRKISVEDKDMTGLTVTIGKGAEIHGHLHIHGVDTLEPPTVHTYGGGNSVWFQLLAQNLPRSDSLQQDFPGYVEDDDTFTIPNLLEGRYQLGSISQVASIYGDSYLEDIRQNGRSIYRDGIVTVENPRVEVELVVNRNGGKIQGTIDTPRTDVPFMGIVVLVPDEPYRGNLALYKSDQFDEAGTFAFAGVAPGSYKIFAFNNLEPGAEQNAEFIARYEQRGSPITSSAGVKTEVLRIPVIQVRSTK